MLYSDSLNSQYAISTAIVTHRLFRRILKHCVLHSCLFVEALIIVAFSYTVQLITLRALVLPVPIHVN